MKKTISLLLTLLICATVCAPALAVDLSAASMAQDQTVVARAEQTEWHYRLYGGQMQKRLWSVTYRVWRTDWMPI